SMLFVTVRACYCCSWCWCQMCFCLFFFFFQAEDGIRDSSVTGVQTCALPISLSRIKHKIVVMSGKGGVGKSTVAANLACVLAEAGTAGLVDADVTGPDIAKLMGVEEAQVKATDTGLEPTTGPAGVRVISMAQMIDRDTAVVWRGPLKIKALKQMLSDVEWGDLDYLVIDLPPGTSDEPLSVAQEIPDADGAVVVTTPQEVSLLDVRKSIAFAKAVKMDILGVIENMSGFVCPHC